MTNKKLFVFDLDNTLAPSKGDLPPESVKLVEKIVTSGKFFAILSSAGLYQIQEKVIPHLNHLPQENIVYGATLGTKIHYKTAEKWVTENHNAFTKQERKEIKVYIDQLARNHPLTARETIGRYFDDRETLLTYSVLGIDAPREVKSAWDPDYEKRKVLKKLIEQKFPHLSVVYGGKSSLDITEKGVDKRSGLQNILNHFSLTPKDTLYTGDEFTELGNDYPLLSVPELETLEVSDYQETVKKMTQILDL